MSSNSSDSGTFGQEKSPKSQARTIVYNVFNYLKEIRHGDSDHEILKETSKATGVSFSTCQTIVNTNKRDSEELIRTLGKKRSRKSKIFDFDEYELSIIRATVSEIFRENKYATVAEILVRIRNRINYKGSENSLRKIMKGQFKYGKINNNFFFIERPDIVAHRHRYLKQIRYFREKLKSFVYISVNEYSEKKQWRQACESVEGKKLNSDKCRRLILLHAGGEGGFIPQAKLIFQSAANSDNYNNEINGNTFKKWFQSQLLPNIPSNSVIIMGNAPYQNMLQEELPTSNSRKAEMLAWLNHHGIPCSSNMFKQDLYGIVKQHKKEKKRYVIDQIASANGHTVIRLPPYHCDLNPMEHIWAEIKESISRQNATFELCDLETLAESAIKMISTEDWKKSIDYVCKLEKSYWQTDRTIELHSEPLIMNTGENSDDSDSDVSSSDISFLSYR